MHINNIVKNYIIPILEWKEGDVLPNNKEFPESLTLCMIKDRLKLETGKICNFNKVTKEAQVLALQEKATQASTVSFNITMSRSCIEEIEKSSKARRDRFRHLFNNSVRDTSCRIGMVLNGIRSEDSFTINYYIKETDGVKTIHFIAVIGFYGANINSWSERVGLSKTMLAHSFPTTHYAPSDKATDYIYVLRAVKQVSFVVS